MSVCGCFLRGKQRYAIFQRFHKRKFNGIVHNNQNAQFDLLSVQSPTRQFRPRRRLGSNTGFNRRSSENNCITCLLTPCHVESRRFSLYIIIALLQNDILSAVIALRKICDKIPSYVNLSICFTVLLHERENYIALTQSTVGLCLRDRRSIAFAK